MSDRLGFILVREGKISQEQLFQALRQQRETQALLGEILIQSGVVSEGDILEVIGLQHGISFVPANEMAGLKRKHAALLDRSVAEIYRIVPLRKVGGDLHFATYNPENIKHLEEIRYFAKTPIVPLFARARDIEAALERIYDLAPQQPQAAEESAITHFISFDDTSPRIAAEPFVKTALYTTQPTADLPKSIPRQIGNYQLLDRVSVGGMAEIFRAVDQGQEPPREVALKMLLPGHADDKKFLNMFRDEARVALLLKHPNIGEVYHYGVLKKRPYLVMEYIRGRDLRYLMPRLKQLSEQPLAASIYVIARIADALGYAHQLQDKRGRQLQLIHRDVSPANILVSVDGQVKLIDFGIAKMLGSLVRTQAGMLKGKLGYMSPEQVACEPLDHRSDQYSLAIILFEMATGKPLFRGKTDIETLEKQSSMRVPSARSLNPALSLQLSEILEQALSRDRNERFDSCQLFARALRGYLAHYPPIDYSSALSSWVSTTLES